MEQNIIITMHEQQQDYCKTVKERHPEHFKGKLILDIGSLDINGNNRYLFDDCSYIGVDISDGDNVNIASLGHMLKFDNGFFDTIISTECFEHDRYWKKTIKNCLRMLKPGGLFLFTCATDGRDEHGTLRSDGGYSSPLTSAVPGWANYYRNLNEDDIRKVIDVRIFSEVEFQVNEETKDLYFYGILHHSL